MKKIIVTLGVLLFFIMNVQSAFASQYASTIGKIENSIYGFQYNDDNEASRLDRIENSVYGTVSSNPTAQRIAKLKKDLAADLMGQEIKPVEDTFAEAEDSYIEKEPVAASNVEYPAVDELEQMVFNQKFSKTDIRQRLSKLEQKTFGKEYNDDLATRTDRLKAEIKPKSLMDNQIAQSSNDFYDGDVAPMDSDYHLNQYQPSPYGAEYEDFNGRQRMMRQAFNNNANSYNNSPSPKKASLTAIERGILKQTYGNETEEHRLSRLENAMFGTNFANDDKGTRLNRVSSAYNAQKSASKYDSNKVGQNITTAVQIGTLILMVLACIL